MLAKHAYILFLIPLVLTAYDQKQAILQAKYSMISHCSNQQIVSWSCSLCKTYPYLTQLSVIEDTNTSIKGYVGYDKSANTIVVAWRGTDNNLWLIESMDYKQIDYQGSFRCGNCKINQGFWDIYYAVHKETQDKVKVLAEKYPNSRISITGHSLGAALATVGALFLYKDYNTRVNSLYLYGSPRVGNSGLANYLHLIIPNIYRVVHYKDVVPHIPPPTTGDLVYAHPAYEVFYDEAMKNYLVCNESGEDSRCSNGVGPVYSPLDHMTYWFRADNTVC